MLNVSNFWGTLINHIIPSDPLSPNYSYIHLDELTQIQEDTMPDTPCRLRLGNEVGKYELINVLSYSNGYITCERAQEGTIALEHVPPVKLESVLTKGHLVEIQNQFITSEEKRSDLVKMMFYTLAGGLKCVLQNETLNFLECIETNPQSLSVKIKSGLCFLFEKEFVLSDDLILDDFVVPVLHQRQDLIIATDSGIQIKTGIENEIGEYADPNFILEDGKIPNTTQQLALATVLLQPDSTIITQSMIVDLRKFM